MIWLETSLPALARYQLASEYHRCENKDVPIIAFEIREKEQSVQMRILEDKLRLFLDLAPDTHLRRFPRLEFSAQPISLPFVDVVGLLFTENHQCFAVMFDMSEVAMILYVPFEICIRKHRL